MRFYIGDKENYSNIFNMDKAPIWFEMVSRTTIVKNGEKCINVKTFRSHRARISVILCISVNGYKTLLC
jgi:hypothetical protein